MLGGDAGTINAEGTSIGRVARSESAHQGLGDGAGVDLFDLERPAAGFGGCVGVGEDHTDG